MAENRQKALRKPRASRSRSCPAEPLRKPSWIRVQAPTSARYQEIKQILREPQPAHRVRGSLLPQHRRMLQPRHRHLHDPGRPVHAPLPVLRRRPRHAAAARRGGAGADRATGRRDGAEVRGDHQRRPRRPARRRRRPFRRLHPRRARAIAAHPHRNPGAGFPRPAGRRAGCARQPTCPTSSTTTWKPCRACTSRPAPAPTTPIR